MQEEGGRSVHSVARTLVDDVRIAVAVLAVASSLALAPTASAQAGTVDYDLVYVRQPRYGDFTATIWPEVFHPARMEPGADLMLLHPDGTEEVLFAGGEGSVTDPAVSLDGKAVYFSWFPKLQPSDLNGQRNFLPYAGADLHRIDLATRIVTQLTFGEFTPNTGAGDWDVDDPVTIRHDKNSLGYGVMNTGPCPLPGGRIAFTSNRNGFVPPREFTYPTFQLFVMDADGSNVTAIAPMTIGSALHPTLLRDGRISFSSYESQGTRDSRVWAIWTIEPDGREWRPLVSAFKPGQAFHFMTQLTSGDYVVEDYYNLNNNGFGALYRFPPPVPGQPAFHSAFRDTNPQIKQTFDNIGMYPFTMSFTPKGMFSLSEFTHAEDMAAPTDPKSGKRVGKFTHPASAPDDDLLVCWSPGPCNDLDRPTTTPYYDGGLYLVAGGKVMKSPNDLILIKNDPAWNEAWPRAVLSWREIHGIDPVERPWLPNRGGIHPLLPAGTPYGLVGSSSLLNRESFPGFVSPWSDTFDGLDAFNTAENDQSSNWIWQGADAGKYTDDDVWAIRLVALEPNSHRSYGPYAWSQFRNHANERMRILGEIPVRKQVVGGTRLTGSEPGRAGAVVDTSFLAKIPADTPFTFQTIDRDGLVLNMAQTWHQVRPGEARWDCGGCHAHSRPAVEFRDTAAARPDHPVFDLSKVTPLVTRDQRGEPALTIEPKGVVDVEFFRDVRPLLQRSCVPCHTKADPTPPGELVLDDTSDHGGVPGDYFRLAEDEGAQYGYPPVIGHGWRIHNASRYVRRFQSRRSLLVWKVFGRRLDGWTNADHPTESIRGDPGTLPPGASPSEADIDFTGTKMPPPGQGIPLTADEQMTIARWVDLGCPIDLNADTTGRTFGWFCDDLRPTLELSLPRAGRRTAPLRRFRIGLADANSGIDLSTLSVRASFAVNGRAAGSQLADLVAPTSDDGVYELVLDAPIARLDHGRVTVSIEDRQGNVTKVKRVFSVDPRPGEQ